MPKKQTTWSRAYNEKSYDRLAVTVPKGRKQAVEAYAASRGESINGLVGRLLRAEMGITEADWKRAPEQTDEYLPPETGETDCEK